MKLFKSKEDKKQIELITEAIDETIKELEALNVNSAAYKEKEQFLTKLYEARAEVKSEIKANRDNLLLAAELILTITNVAVLIVKAKKG